MLFLKKRFIMFPAIVVIGLLVFYNRYLLLQYTISTIHKINVKWMGPSNQKLVALTFDDGPDPRYTPRILSILKKYHTPATFFVEGANVLKYPELVLTEYRAGYEIGNHSFSHAHLAGLTAYEVNNELELTDRAIQATTGRKPVIFRPPYEELSEPILIASRRRHKNIVLSTITLERDSIKSPRAMANRVARRIFPGAIILMHDGRLNRNQTVKALPYLIKTLTAKGYRAVSLQQLLSKSS
jgi:peptidoglycan-N-acetylglucosamine deacetylase